MLVWVRGLIVKVILFLWFLSFNLWKSILFINDELKIDKVFIVIGILVNFSIVVNVIEESGVVVIIIIVLLSIIFIKIGLLWVFDVKIFLMVSKVLLISGVNSLVIRCVNGVLIIIIEIRFKLLGIFFFIYLIRNFIKYFVRKLGIIFVLEIDKLIKIVYFGVILIVIVINIVVVILESELLVLFILFKNWNFKILLKKEFWKVFIRKDV